jgi:hypothetical protein
MSTYLPTTDHTNALFLLLDPKPRLARICNPLDTLVTVYSSAVIQTSWRYNALFYVFSLKDELGMQEDENTVFSERFLNTLCTRGRTRSETKPTKNLKQGPNCR